MKKILLAALTLALAAGASWTLRTPSEAAPTAPRSTPSRPAAQAYRWEPKARDVLASYRLPNTRDSRIGISLGGDISLLAVIATPKNRSFVCIIRTTVAMRSAIRFPSARPARASVRTAKTARFQPKSRAARSCCGSRAAPAAAAR